MISLQEKYNNINEKISRKDVNVVREQILDNKMIFIPYNLIVLFAYHVTFYL